MIQKLSREKTLLKKRHKCCKENQTNALTAWSYLCFLNEFKSLYDNAINVNFCDGIITNGLWYKFSRIWLPLMFVKFQTNLLSVFLRIKRIITRSRQD